MMPVPEVQAWLASLPEDAHVGIDESGLALRVAEDPENYLEIGVLPDPDAVEEDYVCPTCGDMRSRCTGLDSAEREDQHRQFTKFTPPENR